MQIDQRLGQNHLAASQHTSPSFVAGVSRLADRLEAFAIGAPESGLYVTSDLIDFYADKKQR